MPLTNEILRLLLNRTPPCNRCFYKTHVGAVQVYDEPTVLVCYRVTGEEEVPEGVVGVLTPDAPDVLSHLSVRARNMKVSKGQHLR